MKESRRVPITVPDLGSPRAAFCLWHVQVGDRVTEGDRVAEVLIPGAVFDVAAPVSGTLMERTVQPGDALQAIAKRFCINADTFGLFNHTFGYDLQPGDVLVLRPDPTVPWHPKD